MTFYIWSSLKRCVRIVYKDLDLVTINYGINLISEERQCAVNLGTNFNYLMLSQKQCSFYFTLLLTFLN